MSYDLLAIGDIVADEFIRLKDATVHCKVNNEDCEICMRWGDKIPFEFSVLLPAVGNSANAAVAAARLGLSSALRAYVGEDRYGQECLESLKKDGVETRFIETASGKATNHHYVLWFDSERTILVKHEEYDYTVPAMEEPPRWIYLSSLADNSLPYHRLLMQQLAQWQTTKLAFQPGTFQMKMGVNALKDVYARSDIFFCNKEEAERILGIAPTQDMKELLSKVRGLGPKTAVITDGRNGAYAMDEKDAWFVPMYPDERAPYERTGAGDAFASSVVSALALGKTLKEALRWGPVNAMEVVQKIGAQEGLLTREKLEEFLKHAPAQYAVRQL
jgi:sugar/nucleoside kinase (ribokinase family)